MTGSPALLGSRTGVGRSAAVVSLSLLVTALLSGVQALLLALLVGESEDTDAFFAAYAAYSALVLWSGWLRISIVPLLGPAVPGAAFERRVGEVVSRVILLGLVVSLGLLAAAPALGPALTSGLPGDGQETAVWTLVMLAPAAALHVAAAAFTGALGAAQRFVFSSVAYVLGSAAAVAACALLLGSIGVTGASVAILAGAALIAAATGSYLRRLGVTLRFDLRWVADGPQRRLGKRLAGGAALLMLPQINAAISLAVLSGEPGAITVFTYAFLLVSMLVNLSAAALAVSTLPSLLSLAGGGAGAVAERLEAVVPYVFAVLAPLIAAVVSFAPPVLHEVLGGALRAESVDLLYDLILVLSGLAVPSAFFVLGASALLALERWSAAGWVTVAGVAMHAVAVLAAASSGAVVVAAAHVTAAALTAGVLYAALLGRGWARAVGRAARAAWPAFAFALVFPLARVVTGPTADIEVAALAVAIAFSLYVVLVLVLWPAVGRSFRRLLSV